jgi:hypothetical protein
MQIGERLERRSGRFAAGRRSPRQLGAIYGTPSASAVVVADQWTGQPGSSFC